MRLFFLEHVVPVFLLILVFTVPPSLAFENQNTVFNPTIATPSASGINDATKSAQLTGDSASGSANPEVRLQKCQDILAKIKAGAQNDLGRISQGSASVSAMLQALENYYTTNLLPKGKTIANYDALVSDATAKQSSTAAILVIVQNDLNNISCQIPEPFRQFKQFRTDMESLIQSFKNFRLSVKTLALAIRSLFTDTNITITQTPGSGKK
jgi:hypothetical protein